MADLISPEQRASYEEDGYFVVPSLFAKDELGVWIDRLSDLIAGRTEPSDKMLIMRDVMVAKGVVKTESRSEAVAKIQDYQNDPVLFGYVSAPKMLDYVEELIGPDIKMIHNMLINKPPNVDGRHPLHQDLLYFPFRPASSIVATWTALEPVTRENGCLVVVRGSHKGELLAHENPEWEHVNLGYFGAKGASEQTERVHLEMEPGDTVFFHPVLLHGSGRNRTQGFRRAISAHYASCECEYLPGMAESASTRDKVLVRGREYEGKI